MNAWALPQEAHEFLLAHVPSSAIVLELGSGEGTARLVRAFRQVVTVEHDEAYLGKVEGAHYIHAPIVDRWYDPAAIEAGLAGVTPDCVIVDGPPGAIGRAGILRHPHLFGRAPLLIDDVHRETEGRLTALLAAERGQMFSVHCLRNGRGFATVGFPWALHPQTVQSLMGRM